MSELPELPSIKGLLSRWILRSFSDAQMNNPFYRHEIRCYGGRRLPWHSPLVQSLVWLIALCALPILGLLLGRWRGLFLGSLPFPLLAPVVSYALAFWTGMQSIARERRRGTLSQLWCTPIATRYLFPAKLYGCLHPLLPARFFIVLHAFLAGLGVIAMLAPTPFRLLLIALATLIVAFQLAGLYSVGVHLGILNGIRASMDRRESLLGFFGGRYNPFLLGVRILLQEDLGYLIVFLLLLILLPFLGLGATLWGFLTGFVLLTAVVIWPVVTSLGQALPNLIKELEKDFARCMEVQLEVEEGDLVLRPQRL